LQEAAEIKDKKLAGSLVLLLITFSLIIPLLPSTVVKASPSVEIRDWHDLNAVRNNLSCSYVLMNDLDATTTGYAELASEAANEGKAWEPIGIYEQDGSFDPFVGIFDGQGYEIKDLFINRPDEVGVGLFGAVVGWVEGGIIENLSVVNANVTGDIGVGGLVGLNGGTVSNCYCTGNVTGESRVGGLVGFNIAIVSQSSSSTSVTGHFFLVGGLIGYNTGNVSNSYSVARMTGGLGVGGLVGGNDGGTVRNSYSSGSVIGDEYVGGLVGHNWNWDAIVGSCYSSGNVTGDSRVGGLVGYNGYDATVDTSYAAVSVTGNNSVGGLVGYNLATVSNCYSSGNVAGNSSVGGLVGNNTATVSNSFWDREASGMEISDGGVGKLTTEMMDIATFTDTRAEGLDDPWDITAVAHGETNGAYAWNIINGESYPFLSGKQFITYKLTISGTAGGLVAVPGEGVYTYQAGSVIDLVGEPEEGYRFVNWSGDVSTIADVTATKTTITMNESYSITANFEEVQTQNWLMVGLAIAAVMLVGMFLYTHRPRKTR
jgi:hypothetical protein